jgi:hypothetical protein
MLKRLLLIGLTVFLLLLAEAVTARQKCEKKPCPTPTSEQSTASDGGAGTPDRDGDGVPDYVDPCPDAVGSGYTNGCPVDDSAPQAGAAASPEAQPNSTLLFPVSDECLLGSSQPVNVRLFPSTQHEIVGHLQPGETTRGIFGITNALGEFWYLTESLGFVRGDVVRNNGNCRQLPLVQPGAALLHVNPGVVDGLRVFPLQRNLSTLNVTSGLAANQQDDEIGSINSSSDAEAISLYVLRQGAAGANYDILVMLVVMMRLAAADRQQDEATIEAIMQQLIAARAAALQAANSSITQEQQEALDEAQAANRAASGLATLQAVNSTITLVRRYGEAADCPIFSNWVDYPATISDQLETLTPVTPVASCVVEILFSAGDTARPNPTGDGTFDVMLNRLLIPIQP